jgi:hypothetical protein
MVFLAKDARLHASHRDSRPCLYTSEQFFPLEIFCCVFNDVKAIFETLLSHPQLRKRIAQTSEIAIEFSPEVQCLSHLDSTQSEKKDQKPQARSEIHEGQRASSLPKRTDDTATFTTMLNQSLATAHAPETVESDGSGVECSHVGTPVAHDEPSHSPCSMNREHEDPS